MLGLISTTPEATTSVWPSGVARAAALRPILPLAPGRFSSITVCLSTGPSSLAIRRASKSFDPPGAKWAMMVIVRSGHAARTGPLPTDKTITAATAAIKNRSHTRLNMARSPTGSMFSGSPEFDSTLSETLRQARSKTRTPSMFTWRTRCVAPPLVDIVRTSFANSRGQGNVNGKPARRHQGYRAGQFHRRSVVRNAACRYGGGCHQSRAAERRYEPGDAANPQWRKRQLRGTQPQQAQPRARSQAAGSDRNSTQACGAIRRLCRSLPPGRAGEAQARWLACKGRQSPHRLHVRFRFRAKRTLSPSRRRQSDHRGVLRHVIGNRRAWKDADAAGCADGGRIRRAVRNLCYASRARGHRAYR